MSNDKMREALKASECLYAWALSPNLQPTEKIVEKFQLVRTALTQQPESEPSEDENCPFCGGEVDPGGWLDGNGKRGPECEGCGATALSVEVWNRRIVSPQPSPQVPNGFNRLAYNRKTDEWLYINHAGEWQLCPCPVPQAAQVPEGWHIGIEADGTAIIKMPDGGGVCVSSSENEIARIVLRQLAEALIAAPSIAEKREPDGIDENIWPDMVNDLTVKMQAAWIEWQHGEGAESAMEWIHNSLVGPGLIPGEEEPHGKHPQFWFNSHVSDRFPDCFCGNPSSIRCADRGYCCEEHMQEAKRRPEPPESNQ